MLQEGFYSYLGSQASLTSLLGTSRSDKTNGIFYMLAVNEAVFPYITFMRVSGSPSFSYQGANKLQSARFRFSCFALSQQLAVRLAEQLKLIFATYTGTLPDGTVLQNAMLQMEADDAEAQTGGLLYACHVDFAFMFIDNNGA